MSENIKRINRELKFKGSILEFYQDTMEINGDHTAVWDFIHHKGAAGERADRIFPLHRRWCNGRNSVNRSAGSRYR